MKYKIFFTLVICLFFAGCEGQWYKPLIGQPYSGSIDGIVRDTVTLSGINGVFVGLTPSEDAYLFEWAPSTMQAKCVYTTTTRTDPIYGDGHYIFENVDIDMNSKYILAWKEGYRATQIKSTFIKEALHHQPDIYLYKK